MEDDGNDTYEGDSERFRFGAPLGRALGLTRIGIHHERLPPGRRSTYPHAESREEEFVYVLAGTPDVWLNGELYPLLPGDAVGLPAGTGICHTFINNTADEVMLLVVGEADKPENRIRYPMNPDYEARRPLAGLPRSPFRRSRRQTDDTTPLTPTLRRACASWGSCQPRAA